MTDLGSADSSRHRERSSNSNTDFISIIGSVNSGFVCWIILKRGSSIDPVHRINTESFINWVNFSEGESRADSILGIPSVITSWINRGKKWNTHCPAGGIRRTTSNDSTLTHTNFISIETDLYPDIYTSLEYWLEVYQVLKYTRTRVLVYFSTSNSCGDETSKRRDLNTGNTMGYWVKHTVRLVVVTEETGDLWISTTISFGCIFYFLPNKRRQNFFILLWIKKVRNKDKTCIWGSVWWKTEKLKLRNLHVSHTLGCAIPAVIHT
jgi:hypothetical protein